MRSLTTTTTLLLTLAFGACGQSTTEDEDKKKGGDHIPRDTDFFVASAEVPSIPGGAGVIRNEYDAEPLLQKFLHVADRYEICVDPKEVSPEAFAAVEQRLKASSGDIKTRGLEAIVNFGLANIDQFRAGTVKFSSRVTLNLVYLSPTAKCSFAVLRRPASSFPFTEAAFAGKKATFLYAGRIVDERDGAHTNDVPVGYALDTLDTARFALAAEYLVGAYLGFGESPEQKSIMNDNIEPDAAWQLDPLGADYQTVFTFALAYRNILRPTDLANLHHYSDTLGFTTPPTDPLLGIPAGSAPSRFVTVQGHNDLYGLRMAYEPFTICAAFDAKANPTEAQLQVAVAAVFASATAGSLAANLKAAEPKLELAATLAAGAPCQLLVAFRDDAQYPFAGETFSGLYAHEGTVKDAAGTPSPIPVIYIAAEHHAFDPSVGGKWFGHVLHHEAAHFMGFKHSASRRSILSPTGSQTSFDLEGGDRALFAAWAAEALEPR